MTDDTNNKGRPGSPRPSNDPEAGPNLDAAPSVSLLIVPGSDGEISKARSVHRTTSDRVKRLLVSLSSYDSLYLCPLSQPMPSQILSRLSKTPIRQYEIRDYDGNTCYYAVEINKWCNYFFCSNNRTFEIFMYTPNGELVFESVRSCSKALFVFGGDCCCCLSGGIETEANFRHDENYIGSVVSEGNCLSPTFAVQNEDYDEKFYIRGRTCSLWIPCMLCRMEYFTICKPRTKISLGKIRRGYDGLTDDLVPDPNTVGVIFPPRCTPEIKACLLTAGFMLDVAYFQNRGFTVHRFIRQFLNMSIFLGIIFLIAIFSYKLITNS